MSDTENARRVFSNIKVLLETGIFPGSSALAIAEAQQVVAKMLDDMTPPTKETTDEQVPEETGKSVRRKKGAGRMVGS